MTSKPRKKLIRTLVVGAAVLGSLTLTTSAHAAAGSGPLNMGEALYPGQSISSGTTSGTLTMQDNGDLDLQASDGRVCRHSNTTTGSYDRVGRRPGFRHAHGRCRPSGPGRHLRLDAVGARILAGPAPPETPSTC
ncbi:hypothetical protein GQF42_03125 [Streptomyces broussonetiae]|uniref:Uncharacterized protein n=1 Tax=Streptomyces broussonetiae TaxID=2686304 RepID=A0A6I6MPQ2_9ACTN|nr:hypothetical protein [Streptomyces broussonetiae]QHA02418.1 hypothetical protein GQF42_03125 [Streptomyces broussonetiae]